MKTAIADKNRPKRDRDRGAILMVVLIVMVALLGLGMTGLFLTSGSIQMNSNINLRNQALVVAEAGIQRAQAILNNPTLSPNIPSLLGPTVSNPSDEPIQTTDQCQGERRGAILRDNGTPLVDITYPTGSRSADLPATGGTSGGTMVVSSTMGKYTVYVRQDTRDCRMGNFTCDSAPSVDGGVQACPTPPPVGVPPNGVVVLRSEGVASDGRTRVVLEVTMSPSHGAGLGTGAPLSALCASGANGCDDNTSVQNGLVVTSPGPSNGGASGSGAGGAAGSGAGGVVGGGGSTGIMPGAGGATGAAGAAGVPGGTGGAGGGGTGGSTGCQSFHGARVATMGVWGLWNAYGAGSSNDSGSAMFHEFLDKNFGGCEPIGSINNFGNGRLTKADLAPYNVIIALDLFHSNADRWNCASQWNTGCSNGYLTLPNGQPDWAHPTSGHTCFGTAAGLPQLCPTPLCTTCPRNSTSYMLGNQPLLTAGEITVITDWLKAGNGIVTTMGYFYDAPQVGNANKILRQVGLAYQTTDGSDTAAVLKALGPPNGVDLCSTAGPSCPGGDLGGDFLRADTPGSAPFNFLKTVNRLEVRGTVPLAIVSNSPPIAATVKLSTKVQCARTLLQNNRCLPNPPSNAPAQCDATVGTVPNWQNVGFTVEDIGGSSSGGRIVAWGDEWLTYNTLWSAYSQDTYDLDASGNLIAPCPASPPVPYQAAEFWENVIAWLAVNNPDAANNN